MMHRAQHAKPMSRWKKITISSVGILALMASGAYAYFNLDASGNGYVTDEPASPWVVTVATPTGGYLAPGNGAVDTDNVTIINGSSSPAALNAMTAALTMDPAGGVYDAITQKFVDGCLASWFTVTWGDGGVPLPHTYAPGTGATLAAVQVTMPANSGTDQSPCMGLNPQVTVGAS